MRYAILFLLPLLLVACDHIRDKDVCHTGTCYFEESNFSPAYRQQLATGEEHYESYEQIVARVQAQYYANPKVMPVH